MRMLLPVFATLIIASFACTSSQPQEGLSGASTIAASSNGVYLAVPRSPAPIAPSQAVSVREPDCDRDNVKETCHEIDLLVTNPDGTSQDTQYLHPAIFGDGWAFAGVRTEQLGDYQVRVLDHSSGQEYARGSFMVANECPVAPSNAFTGCETYSPSPTAATRRITL
jgi:hypothetical protein